MLQNLALCEFIMSHNQFVHSKVYIHTGERCTLGHIYSIYAGLRTNIISMLHMDWRVFRAQACIQNVARKAKLGAFHSLPCACFFCPRFYIVLVRTGGHARDFGNDNDSI